ncbi:hypothetical protein [Nostocoides sp. Soil756]|nr:hypothetical protein [Tetrasphaera sp. Soil756]
MLGIAARSRWHEETDAALAAAKGTSLPLTSEATSDTQNTTSTAA